MHNFINRCQVYELLEFPIFRSIVVQTNMFFCWSAMLVCPARHTRRFDSLFSHNSKSYSKFELPYEDGSRTVIGVK